MLAREEELLHVIDVVTTGSSISIVGDHGSGRSHLMQRVHDHFDALSYVTLGMHGSPAFRNTQMSALTWAGVRSNLGLAGAFADLSERIGNRNAVILLDDYDDVDDASWGVLSQVRRVHGTPIVTAGLVGATSGRAYATAGFIHDFQIRLAPLRRDELQEVISKRAGVHIEQATMTSIYAKTGGNVGLALTLFEAAVREGRIRIGPDMATATGDLWTTSLTAIVETLLKPLTIEQRDALEAIAFLGPSPMAAALRVADADMLKQLDMLGFVDLNPSSGTHVIAVRQPLISEFFRHSPHNIRRLLVNAAVSERITGDIAPSPAILTAEHTALFTALMREHQLRRLSIAQEAWTEHPSKDTAVELVDALSKTRSRESEIQTVMRESAELGGTEAGLDRWALTFSQSIAAKDPAAAVDWLRVQATMNPKLSAVLLARAAILHATFVEAIVPDWLPDPATLDADHSGSVQLAHAFIALLSGDVDDAEAMAVELRKTYSDSALDSVMVVACIAQGNFRPAREISARGLRQATAAFDVSEMFRYAYLGGISAMFGGRFGEAEEMVASVSQLALPRDERMENIGVLAVGAAIASRRGGIVADVPPEPDEVFIRNGPFPGQQRDWVRSDLLRSQGDAAGSADVLSTLGDTLWEMGNRFTAAYAYLVAAETHPVEARLRMLDERVALVGGRAIQVQRELMIARIREDLPEMIRAVKLYEKSERWAQSLTTWREIEMLGVRDGDSALVAESKEAVEQILTDLGDERVMGAPGRLPRNLTDRESEVARLVAAGLSNAEIAKMLYVSVRTVETHLGRVLRKAGVNGRDELRGLYHI